MNCQCASVWLRSLQVIYCTHIQFEGITAKKVPFERDSWPTECARDFSCYKGQSRESNSKGRTRNPSLLNEAICSQIYSKILSQRVIYKRRYRVIVSGGLRLGQLTPFRIKTLMKCSASFGPKTSGCFFRGQKVLREGLLDRCSWL